MVNGEDYHGLQTTILQVVTTRVAWMFSWRMERSADSRLGCPREQNTLQRIGYFYTLLGFPNPGVI